MNRTAYIIGAVLLIVVVVGGGYLLRSQIFGGLSPNSDTNAYENQTHLPSAATGASGNLPAAAPTAGISDAFGVVAQSPSLDYFVDPQNNIFLLQPNGHVVKLSGGAETVLSSTDLQNIIRASFSFDGKKALVVFGNPATPQTSVFDLTTKAWTPLSTQIKNPVWSPSDYRIAFFSAKDQSFEILTTLDLRQPKTAVARAVMQFHAQDLDLSWPAADLVYVFEKPTAYATGSLWRMNLKTLSLASILQDQPGLMTAWNAAGNQGVLFTAGSGGRGGSFSFIDDSGKIVNQFALATLPSKCTFQKESVPPPAGSAKTAKPTSADFVICGFPKNTQEFNLAPQPDSYLENDFWTVDYFYKINLKDGVIKNLLPAGDYALDATNLRILNKKLFFLNRYDKRLFTIAL